MGSKYSVNFLVPKAINQPIRSPFALFYLILIAKTGMKNKTFFNSSSQAKIIKNWLRLFILLFSISFIFYIIAQLAFYFDLKIFFENLWFYYLIHGIAFTYLLINLLLIVFPQVLYGLPIPKLVINDKDYDLATDPFQEISESSHPIVKIKSTNSLPFYSFEYEKEMEKAINIWISEKKYLELNASLISLSDYTNIPVHHLSYNFNSLLKIKYSDWRNTLRIEYAKSQIDAGLNKSITLEALAIESGFASQATFIKSFKNVFGCTPSEYIKTKKH
jgi:AraC-like DNA-binding protein